MEALVRKHSTPQQIAQRGRMILLAAEGMNSDPTHKVVFHYTPNHSSWINQIEIWLSILVRKVLRRGSFKSVQDLEAKVLAFIDSYNATMARPFKWTSQGKALTV